MDKSPIYLEIMLLRKINAGGQTKTTLKAHKY